MHGPYSVCIQLTSLGASRNLVLLVAVPSVLFLAIPFSWLLTLPSSHADAINVWDQVDAWILAGNYGPPHQRLA